MAGVSGGTREKQPAWVPGFGPRRFHWSADHCAAASPFLVPGPRPSKESSEIALSRAERSAALMSGLVSGWPGYWASAGAAISEAAKAAAMELGLSMSSPDDVWRASYGPGPRVQALRLAH